MNYSVSIDVPRLDDGLRFYRDALGFAEIARPVATYAILECGNSQIGLIEKPAGSTPAKGSDDVRRYERHWTPVHIDFHVEDFEAFLAKAVNAGGQMRAEIRGRRETAHCVLQRPVRQRFLRGGKFGLTHRYGKRVTTPTTIFRNRQTLSPGSLEILNPALRACGLVRSGISSPETDAV